MTAAIPLFALAAGLLALGGVVVWRYRVACRTYEAYQADAAAERARTRAQAEIELLEALWALRYNALGSEEST